MAIHEDIKRLRRDYGLTQQQVADRLGITRGAYCQYESGARTPKPDTVERIYAAIDPSGKERPSNEVYVNEENRAYQTKISIEELDVLEHYRSLNRDGKNLAFEILRKIYESPAFATDQRETSSQEENEN